MIKQQFTTVLAVTGLLLCQVPGVSADPTELVQICHKPGEKNQKILEVSPSSLSGHHGHGDYDVVDEVCDGVDNDCDGNVDNDVVCIDDGFDCTNEICGGELGCIHQPDDTYCVTEHGDGSICMAGFVFKGVPFSGVASDSQGIQVNVVQVGQIGQIGQVGQVGQVGQIGGVIGPDGCGTPGVIICECASLPVTVCSSDTGEECKTVTTITKPTICSASVNTVGTVTFDGPTSCCCEGSTIGTIGISD